MDKFKSTEKLRTISAFSSQLKDDRTSFSFKRSYEPINICTERRAVVMIFKGVARMEEHNGHLLHSSKLTMHAPSVIRLAEYRHIPHERRSLSRKNILLRDQFTCQYCGRFFSQPI
jgi:5-methylcytosine-specific restriction endonuclease McrA